MGDEKKKMSIVQGIQPEIKPIYKYVCSSNKIKIKGLFHIMTACWLPLHMHSLCHSVHRMNQNQGHINDHNIWHHQYDLQRTSKKEFWGKKKRENFNQEVPAVMYISAKSALLFPNYNGGSFYLAPSRPRINQ